MGEQFVGSNYILTEKLILIHVGSSLSVKKVKYLFCRPRTYGNYPNRIVTRKSRRIASGFSYSVI